MLVQTRLMRAVVLNPLTGILSATSAPFIYAVAVIDAVAVAVVLIDVVPKLVAVVVDRGVELRVVDWRHMERGKSRMLIIESLDITGYR